MKYAIDRYIAGKEHEVSASEFYDLLYIPRKYSRFFCPECGEQVYWRSRGGSKPDVFYHKVKTDFSPECDKRVDGNSGLSLNERVGLPVYLTKHIADTYVLNISFPALGNQELKHLSEENVSVTISSGKQKSKTIGLNFENFYDTESTLIPIDFIPEDRTNYHISVGYSRWKFIVDRKWSTHADGFDYNGGIFSFSENGGKKIRRGDSISIGKKYLVLSRYFHSFYDEIKAKRIGKCFLNETEYGVYSFIVEVSTDNEGRFSLINNYVKSTFGVWLLERTPEIIPLWPPVVETDMYYSIENSESIICSVFSGNDLPRVYKYDSYGANELELMIENNVCYVEIPTKKEINVSVDRKYVGRELTFSVKEKFPDGIEPTIEFKNALSQQNNLENIGEKDIKGEFYVCSQMRGELYFETFDKTYQKIPIREEEIRISGVEKISSIYFVSEETIIKQVKFQKEKRNDRNNSEFYFKDIFNHNHGEFKSIPLEVLNLIKKYPVIKRFIKQGKLPTGILIYIAKNKENLL